MGGVTHRSNAGCRPAWILRGKHPSQSLGHSEAEVDLKPRCRYQCGPCGNVGRSRGKRDCKLQGLGCAKSKFSTSVCVNVLRNCSGGLTGSGAFCNYDANGYGYRSHQTGTRGTDFRTNMKVRAEAGLWTWVWDGLFLVLSFHFTAFSALLCSPPALPH